MVESSYTTTPQLSSFKNLPPELTNAIINLLPPDSLASIRLCWPRLDGVVLSRQFKTIRVTFAEKDIERLQAVSSTFPYYVQELVFTTAQSRYTYSDKWGQIFTDEKYQKYVKDIRRKFLACVDSLPNLHTFTSELGPISGIATKEHTDGLVYAILPALCRSSSRITTLRCQDPLAYMRWFLSKVRVTWGPPEEMIKVEKSQTIKLTFIQFKFSAKHFKTFIQRHASTLRHIMLHNCRSDPQVISIIKFAASCSDVRLHRFAVFPAHESHPRFELLDESYPDGEQIAVEKPRIVPESAVLGFINSEDPQHPDPFAAWTALEYEYWGTVQQKAESTSIKWPQDNGMVVKCKQCIDKTENSTCQSSS
ncbi:hypothetical protein FMEXI_11285 [Fusarium mexicanum]|uniref:F-box domain-containing protein n=1 Tax=Fusarium mexicanum TaxID=751941 RepID=A0A8H5IDS5_9HYPO|nr:hypothetical protein FMEXI_11285 [Fusarium mexicanum]